MKSRSSPYDEFEAYYPLSQILHAYAVIWMEEEESEGGICCDCDDQIAVCMSIPNALGIRRRT